MPPTDLDYLKFLHIDPSKPGLNLIAFDSGVNNGAEDINFEIFNAATRPSIESPVKITILRDEETPLDVWVNAVALAGFFKKLGAEERAIEAAISTNTLGILHRDLILPRLMRAMKLPPEMEEIARGALTELMTNVYFLKEVCQLNPALDLPFPDSPFTLQSTPSSAYLCYNEERFRVLTTHEGSSTPATLADPSPFTTPGSASTPFESPGISTYDALYRASLPAHGGAGAPTPDFLKPPIHLDVPSSSSPFEASISPAGRSSVSPVKMMGVKRPDPIHPKALELIRKWAPRLSDDELRAIQTFLLEHGDIALYKAKENKIARTVEVAEREGRIVHLTRTRLFGDSVIGKGRSKWVKSAVNLDTGEAYAIFKTRLRLEPGASTEEMTALWKELMNEISALDRFETGSCVLSYLKKQVSYYIESGHRQEALVVRLKMMEGDLINRFFEDDSVRSFTSALVADKRYYESLRASGHEARLAFLMRYRKAIIMQIFQGVLYLHQVVKMVHGDLKPDNFMLNLNVHRKPPSPEVALGDLGKHTMLEKFPTEVFPGTPAYTSPLLYQRYFKSLPFTEDEALHADGWSCALTLLGLFFSHELPRTYSHLRSWVESPDTRKTMREIHDLKQEQLDPEPKKDTPQWVIWGLLQVDPSSPDRLNTKDLTLAFLNELDWS